MRKIELYLQFAKECRGLARAARSQEHRDVLLEMAQTWDLLAMERSREIGAPGTLKDHSDNGGSGGPGNS
jgi:microcystin degradation protein MlrC